MSIIALGNLSAQVVEDTVHTSASYANDNYYTLNSGNQFTVDRTNWDLAFASDGISGFATTVRINGGNGTELFVYSNDTTDWSTLDTTGFDWSQNALFNSSESWEIGAFDNMTLTGGFDLGWGEYNVTTHQILGTRLFILKLSDGTYRKIVIDGLISGAYTFRYAELSGANQTTGTVTKTNHGGKNFGYYSILNNTDLDREPASSSWDLVFTKYVTMYAPGVPYPVTGVLAHQNVKIAQANNVVDPYAESYTSHTMDTVSDVIGWDWKEFNMTTFQYEIEDSLVYFVEDQSSHIYRLVFTGFTGSSAGEYHLDREQITGVGIEESLENSNTILNVYPNPAVTNVTVTFNALTNNTSIALYDLTGKEVLNQQLNTVKGLSQQNLDVSNLTQGVYFIRITSGANTSTQKLIIR